MLEASGNDINVDERIDDADEEEDEERRHGSEARWLARPWFRLVGGLRENMKKPSPPSEDCGRLDETSTSVSTGL